MVILMHVLAGGLALAAGYVALASAKGSRLHRRSGMLFVYTMLAMALSGTAIAIVQGVAPSINVPAGVLTSYLVVTALTTVWPPSPLARRLDLGAMAVALAGGGASVALGIASLAGGGGRGARASGVLLIVFGGIGLLAGIADVRRRRSAALLGAARLTRHLWRMCTALLIASLAFFLGQADEFPQAVRASGLLPLPVLAVFVAMVYWLWRVRRGRSFPAITAPAWLTRRRLALDEADFRDEIRAHLAIAERERTADGADADTAHYAALKAFGNVTLTTEAARRVWTPWWLEALRDLLSDVHYAVRTLRKNPAFTLTVIGVLAIGIGLNAAVFTMLKGIALTPLGGVAGAARLHVIYGETNTGRSVRVSYPDYVELRDRDRAFSGLFGSALATVNLGKGRRARQVSAEFVTGNYFQILGVRAQRGRTVQPSDEIAPGSHPVAVLSAALWRREFGADPGIVGTTVEINNHALTVVGVTEDAFHGTIVSYDIELFIPVMTAPELGFAFGSKETTPSGILADRSAGLFFPQGYLRPGTGLAVAASQTDAIWAALSPGRPVAETAQRLRVVPFSRSPGSGQTYVLPTLMVLSAMGLLVLMIACANIAGLVLVRGVSRRGEIAVRLALGATRMRIVRLLILENLVLAIPGAALGLLLSWRGIPPLITYIEWLAAPQRVFFNLEVDSLAIGFAGIIACVSALVFGLVPALQSARVDLVSVINEDASPRGAARGRLREGLVVAQVAVSLLLLIGAGLVTRSLEAARTANPGFDPNQMVSVELDVRQNGYDAAQGGMFYRRLLDAVRSDAGIESATLAEHHPLGLLDTRMQRVTIEGYEPGADDDLAYMSNTIGPDYFRTLRIPLVAGREFEDRDDGLAVPAAIVNLTLARRFWHDAATAIGKRIRVADGDWRTVVGVAADVKYSRINEAPRPYVYLPFFQAYRSRMILHSRGPAPLDVLLEQAVARVVALDAELPIPSARPFTEMITGALIFYNFAAKMLLVFGAVGMALAVLGTYGLVSYTVRQTTHEIGIRIALGASAPSVLRGVLARGLRLGAIGAALGGAAALGAGSLLDSVLFGVSATDAVSFTRALAVVLSGVIVATLVPAWRAARTNPLSALRHQ